MERLSGLSIVYPFSILIGIVSNIFVDIKISYIILLVLILIDTLLGIFTAIKFKRFSSNGLCKLIKKIVTYTITILVVRLFEISIMSLINTSFISQIIVAFLSLTEVISILENMTMIGVPIPSNIISIFMSSLKFLNVNKIITNIPSTDKIINEIDEILKYQVSTFKDENIVTLLNINFNIWKFIILQINMLHENDSESKDAFYFKILSLIELGIKEAKIKYNDQKVPLEYIEDYEKTNKAERNKWLIKIKNICYLDETESRKKDLIIESILIMIYKSIIDLHKNQ